MKIVNIRVNMKIYVLVSVIVVVTTLAETIPTNSRADANIHVFTSKRSATRPANQAKRETSISYAATNIDSKEGTRVKTITVIKNHSGKRGEKLAINPDLHKNDEWATAFRDNFDSFGVIPDVPDIDDLFEFVKKKPQEKKEEENKTEAPKMKMKEEKEEFKPVEEPSSEDITTTQPVQKIKGDAEVIDGVEKNQKEARSQSLDMDKSAYRREPLINYNISSPQHSMHHFFEKYVQEIPKGYDYPKPCGHGGKGSISITNPSSGRSYDIPIEEDAAGNPYIAPVISKKTAVQTQNNTQNVASAVARANFPINSILPSLQPTPDTFTGTTFQQPQQQSPITPTQALPQQVGFSTSQRPYLAPNIRANNGFSVNTAQSLRPIYRNDIPNYRRNNYNGFTISRSSAGRSRGLKY